MNRFRWVSFALLILIWPRWCGAAVFERDWKTPRDGLLTYDDVNQREWLDLRVSDISQFPHPHVENAIAEIKTGGLFDGFKLATGVDVTALARSAGIDTDTSSFMVNEDATRQLIVLLGTTFMPEFGDSIFSIGFLDEFDPPHRESASFFVQPFSGSAGMAGLNIFARNDLAAPRYRPGLMIYRTIPEPSTLLSALLWLACVSRRRYCAERINECAVRHRDDVHR